MANDQSRIREILGDTDRRKFLRNTLAGTSMIGFAGCSGSEDGGDGGGGDGETETGTETPPPDNATPEPDIEYEPVGAYNWVSISRSQNPRMYEFGVLQRKQLERLGFEFDVDVVEIGTWVDKLFARDWDFFHLWWSGSIERLFPYYMLYNSFHSKFATEDAGNFEYFKSEQYDKTIETFNSSMNTEDQIKWSNRAQEIISENAPVAFSQHPDQLVCANSKLFGNWKEMIGNFAYWNVNTLRDIEPKSGAPDQVVYATTRPLQNYPNFFSVTGPESLMVHKMTYESLVELDYQGQPYERAAESYEVVEDDVVDVTLRDDLQWHDGGDVTPEDVMFTWDYCKEHGIPWMQSAWDSYDTSEKMDERTVRFKLNYPFSGFIPVSLFRVPILPKHVWDGIVEEKGLEHPSGWSDPDMTGAGPFKFVNYNSGNQIVLEKNPDHYWADEFPFERLIYKVYGSNSAAVGDVIRGKATFSQYLGATDWDRADNNQNTKAFANPNVQTDGAWVVNTNPPFNDVMVRRAISHGISGEEIINIVYNGHGDVAKGTPIAPANETFHYKDANFYEGNLGKAREYLQKSGFRWDEGGKLLKPKDWEPNTTYVKPEGFSDWDFDS
jgi:peptide/nickel transport system substrate-binding protein